MAVSYKNRIRSLRKKLKMTQEQMAEQLFIDQTTLSMYECGNRDIPVTAFYEWRDKERQILKDICNCYGIETKTKAQEQADYRGESTAVLYTAFRLLVYVPAVMA